MSNLLVLHLKEEWRMLTSYFSSEKLFFVFPAILVAIGFFMSWLVPLFETAFDMRELLVAFHYLLAMYGLFVGVFGFFADEVAQTWFRDAHLLIHLHSILPVSFRKIFTWFYIKDIVYYVSLTIIPLFLGAFLSFSVSWWTLTRLFLSSGLAFLMGVSISFLVSSLYVRYKYSIVVVGGVLAGLIYSGLSYQDFPPIALFFAGGATSLFFSVVVVIVFSVGSLIITSPVERARTKSYSKSSLFSRFDPVLAKEIIDVKRSGTWRIIITSYLFPLFFLYGIFYFSQRLLNFDLQIPLVFYAVFIGYLSTLVYSWLNNIDLPSSASLLPMTTSQLIKKKIILFVIASLGIAIGYLVVLGYLLEDLEMLPLSAVVMGATSFYVAVVTAWLCGLYPNTRLFDGTILFQYLGIVLPVLVVLSILSLMEAHLIILVGSLVVFLVSLLVYLRLDRKYKKVPL